MKPEATTAVSVQGRVLTRHAIHRHGSLVLQYYLATAQGPVLVEVQGTEHIVFVIKRMWRLYSYKRRVKHCDLCH